MTIKIIATDLHVLNMRTRMPFRYGIAEMTALPHLFVRVLLQVDGKEQWGIAAEGLPPKWFTKNPTTHFKDDLDEMLDVIRQACLFAQDHEAVDNPFQFFLQIYWNQYRWGEENNLAPLLSNLGTSLVERAMLDAFCRGKALSFGEAVRSNALGMEFESLNAKITHAKPLGLLPRTPLRSVALRHTIGFGDPLTDDEIPADERLSDGLPQSLAASISAYGLTHFKIKINGDLDGDMERLRRVGDVIAQSSIPEYGFTLDGNEQFTTVDHFRTFWETFTQSDNLTLKTMQRHLLFVEQPFHREIALTPELGRQLLHWDERPPIIIDESDGHLLSLDVALMLGYNGTSHKNCKGIFKGIANACYIAQRQEEDPSSTYILSGEDLANVGPVALLQDLTVMATLGIPHVERNGHHYFRGLSALPNPIQKAMVDHHGDLYRSHSNGFPAVHIQHGRLDLTTLINAPFGVGFELDPTCFTPLDQWQFDSL